mmetsp:Transcript_20615/g.51255  ORF Transcript_20615/g.51255 Transcript_20615/m.51255 type:complete len:294 (-) Transcript_20615:138-1019(-)
MTGWLASNISLRLRMIPDRDCIINRPTSQYARSLRASPKDTAGSMGHSSPSKTSHHNSSPSSSFVLARANDCSPSTPSKRPSPSKVSRTMRLLVVDASSSFWCCFSTYRLRRSFSSSSIRIESRSRLFSEAMAVELLWLLCIIWEGSSKKLRLSSEGGLFCSCTGEGFREVNRETDKAFCRVLRRTTEFDWLHPSTIDVNVLGARTSISMIGSSGDANTALDRDRCLERFCRLLKMREVDGAIMMDPCRLISLPMRMKQESDSCRCGKRKEFRRSSLCLSSYCCGRNRTTSSS